MNVLVTVASRHGATGEIGELLAVALRDAGLTAEAHRPQEVVSLAGYDAIVLGSAVYAGRWLEAARAFADRHAAALATRPVWLFSSGPLGDPPVPSLGLLERTPTRSVRAPDGDFRDWDAIGRWAREIARQLTPEEVLA